MIELFAKTQSGETVSLDIFGDDPIKISLNVEDVYDAGIAAGSYSQTFRLPFTKKNEKFFKSAFNANSINFNPTYKADAFIQTDGFYFTGGNLRLTNIYTNEYDKSIEYECVFMGETNDLSSSIGNKFLSQLTPGMTGYVHDLTYSAVTTSWAGMTAGSTAGYTGGLYSGDILYPLVEWGYSYNKDNQPDITTLTYEYPSSFDDTNHPLDINQMKPAIRAKVIWDQIFTQAGYGYTGSFFDSNRWKSLYVITDSVARTKLITSFESSITGKMPYGIGPSSSSYLGLITTIDYDPSNTTCITPDATQGAYVCPVAGSYKFFYTFEYSCTTNMVGQSGYVYFKLWDLTTNTVKYNSTKIVTDGIGTISTTTSTITCVAGHKYQWKISCATPIYVFSQTGDQYANWGCNDAPVSLDPSTILPATIKQIDFIKGIVDKFKLVLVPDKTISNKFQVTPWVDWIRQGNELDWSDKLDGNKDFKVSPLFYTQSREILFQDAEDSDYVNTFYTQNYKRPYGQLRLDSGIELIKGTKTNNIIFAPTPLEGIAQATGTTAGAQFLIPHLAKDNAPDSNVGKREPIQPKLRLLFYNGLQTAPVTWYLNEAAGGATGATQTSYPLVSNFESWPPQNSTFDLNWQSYQPLWDPITTGITGAISSNTMFTTYWGTWYNSYLNTQSDAVNSKLAEGTFYLTDQDVMNLNFNDRIHVKDTMWYPMKVSDHALGKNKTTKVQLIKIGNEGVTAGVSGPGGTGQTGACSLCNTWEVYNPYYYTQYVYYKNCDTGQLVNSYIPAQSTIFICACNGYTPYSSGGPFVGITFVQPWCFSAYPNGYTGPTGGTGGTAGYNYTLSNTGTSDTYYEYTSCVDGTTGTIDVPAFTTQTVQDCGTPTGPDLTVTQLDAVSATGSIFLSGITDAPTTFDGIWTVQYSKDSAYYEDAGYTGTYQDLLVTPVQALLPDPFLYARVNFEITADGATGETQIGVLLADTQTLYMVDISRLGVGDTGSVDTPTVVNGITYDFSIKNQTS